MRLPAAFRAVWHALTMARSKTVPVDQPPRGFATHEPPSRLDAFASFLGPNAVDRIALLNRVGRPYLFVALATCIVLFVLGYGSAMVASAWRAVLADRPIPEMFGELVPLILGLAPVFVHQITRPIEKIARVAG